MTLEPLTTVGEGRTKKEAEQAAAGRVYEAMVADGWYDPAAPQAAKKSGGVVSARGLSVGDRKSVV